MKSLPHPTASRARTSSVSQVLRAWEEDGTSAPLWRIRGTLNGQGLSVHVASGRALRERAYGMAQRIYSAHGYATLGVGSVRACPYDFQADVLTLLACTAAGAYVGTITLIPDSNRALPCDEIYHEEVEQLRAEGCRLAEVTRLAIEPEGSQARNVLLHLFNLCYIYARRVNNCTDLLVEVNPRHAAYYKRLLLFQQVGPERACVRVQNAPAVLLRLNMAAIETAIKGAGGTEGRDSHGARLHRYPITVRQEAQILRALLRQHKPMSAEEVRYFRLA